MKSKIINIILVLAIVIILVLIVLELPKNKSEENEQDFYTFLMTEDIKEDDSEINSINTIYAFDKDDKCVDTRIKYIFEDEETAKNQYEKLKKEESNYNIELHSGSVIYSTNSNNEKTKTEIKNSIKNTEFIDI